MRIVGIWNVDNWMLVIKEVQSCKDKERDNIVKTHFKLIKDSIVRANSGIVGDGGALETGERMHRLRKHHYQHQHQPVRQGGEL